MLLVCFFFFKQKTAYEMRISDWSSDVCSSDLDGFRRVARDEGAVRRVRVVDQQASAALADLLAHHALREGDERRAGQVGVVDKGPALGQIGRASCREKVCQGVDFGGGRSINKKHEICAGTKQPERTQQR